MSKIWYQVLARDSEY